MLKDPKRPIKKTHIRKKRWKLVGMPGRNKRRKMFLPKGEAFEEKGKERGSYR